jgi:membrane peptidoglycan carboxypeptidase
MLEHAAGYSVFAAEGVRNDPTPLLKVEDAEGRTLFQFAPGHGKRVVSAQLAYEVDDILLGYAPYWHVEMMGPTAGKSGTTDDNADLWYMGYTPDLVVASWMAHTGHNPNGTPVGRYSLPAQFGVTTAVYIFRDLLPVFYHGRGIPQFQRPGGVSGGKVPCGLASPSPRRFRTPSPLPSPSPLYCSQGELRLEH